MPGMVITIDVEFPDRPSSEPVAVLDETLAVLERHQARALFLVQGRWALAYPERMERFARNGNIVGLHGHSHVDYRRLSATGVEAELRQGLASLQGALPGNDVKWCRLPYGQGTTEPRIARRIERVGLTPLGWDWSSFDWDASLPEDEALARLIPAATRGGLLLFHSWPARTPRLLDGLLADGRASRVASVDELTFEAPSPQGWRLYPEKVDAPR
jgi:peptidoglycan-N-acetylglucosamine deacetylase